MPSFQYPYLVWLLATALLLAGLYIYAIRQKSRIARKIGSAQLLANYNPTAYKNKFILAFLSVAILAIAIASPRLAGKSGSTQRSGIDVMFALDVSKSMLAKDISPSRLERARQLMARIISQSGENRIGLVVFAGKAYLQMPLTSDHTAAAMFISVASPESVPTQGTVIAEALSLCNESFDQRDKKYKSIVLISDGEDHDEQAVKVARELRKQGVVIHTIGIGSPGGAPLLDPVTNMYKKDAEGNQVLSRLHEAWLSDIADAGGGTYQRFTQTETVRAELMSALAQMEKRPLADESNTEYQYFFPWLLALVLILLLWEWFIPERRQALSLPKAPVLAMLMLCFCTGLQTQAQEANKTVREGNRLYQDKEYDKAADQYRKALEQQPGLAAAKYNLGHALYKAGKKEEAITAYKDAMEALPNATDQSNAWYNQGVAWQNMQKLKECISAYKESLRLDPTNQDARQNLQQALKQMEQQQQQQQKNKNEEQKKDSKQQEQPQQPDQQNKQKEPRQQPSKISRQEAENRLKALLQQEKALQDKLNRQHQASPVKPDKDW